MTLSARKTYFAGLTFLIVPLLIWCFGWLKTPYFVLTAGLLVAGLILIWKRNDAEAFCSSEIYISIPLLAGIGIMVLFWCILGGHGGFLYQSSDWNARNAILRDLITYDWPTVYENGNALCYYFGFWLVPALFGKLCLWMNFGFEGAWIVANIALLLWAAAGVFLAVMLFLQLVKSSNRKAIIASVVIFVFFSGMDIVGLLLTGDLAIIETRLFDMIHIEWWAGLYQFSSFTTQLFWVFNQAVPAWIATLLILSTAKVSNDIFIGTLSAFLCPLPTMGLLFIGIAKLIDEARGEGICRTIRMVLSLQNLASLIPLIAIALFLILNQRATLAAPVAGESTLLFHIFIGGFTVKRILKLIVFFMLECGILLLILFPSEKKNPYWWSALILCMVANVVRMGPSSDFAMRASIPGLMVLAVMIAKHLVNKDLESYYQWLNEFRKEPINQVVAKAHSKALRLILIGCLAVGAVTPLVEIARGPAKMIEMQQIPAPCDEIKTLGNGLDANFVTPDYRSSVFAQTIGR